MRTDTHTQSHKSENRISASISIHLADISYSNTTVYYVIHKRSECIPVDSDVTNLIHDRRSCVDLTLEVEANVARCVHSSVNTEQARRETQQWVMRRLPTADSIVEIGRKSRS